MTQRPSFSPAEILLLGPGPSPVHPQILAAQAAPVLGHLDPDFVALMDRVQADLRQVFATQNPLTLPISGTGSAGMEACVVNTVEPGDRCVIGIHGVFGQRMKEICERQGGRVEVVASDFGQALDAEAMIRRIQEQETKIVGFVHAETSTGVLMPDEEVEAIARAAHEAGALVILDCVTSLAGSPVRLDDWQIDAAYAGTQKCLGVPPGLSPLSFSPAALSKAAGRTQPTTSWYFDVNLLSGYWGTARSYHHTAPISAIYGLAAGLDIVLREGLEPRIARHRQVAQALIAGLAALGLDCLVEEAYRCPMLTTVCVPTGIDAKQVQSQLRQEHAIEIGGGLGSLAGKVWRIGLMGYGARMESVTRVLAALGDALDRQGHKSDIAAAIQCARAGACA